MYPLEPNRHRSSYQWFKSGTIVVNTVSEGAFFLKLNSDGVARPAAYASVSTAGATAAVVAAAAPAPATTASGGGAPVAVGSIRGDTMSTDDEAAGETSVTFMAVAGGWVVVGCGVCYLVGCGGLWRLLFGGLWWVVVYFTAFI
jgi:hypothetical protein